MAGKSNVADYLSRLPSTLIPAHNIPPTNTNVPKSINHCLGVWTIKTIRFADVVGLPLVQYQLFCRGHCGLGSCVCGECEMAEDAAVA